ncbi:formylglycine-generating enzyme family protein [Methylocella silvestris]|nr:formylglycine-generating enzyme family protein [Methylocella silvestris]
MAQIPAGLYLPFFQANPGKSRDAEISAPTQVGAFRLDVEPIANRQFLAFVRERPEWRKSQVKPLFADHRYLAKWPSDLQVPDEAADEPVTNVSWFAAQAYCEARGLQLPTSEQFEYALADQGRDQAEVAQRSLDWFGSPNPTQLPAIGRGKPNGFGVRDLVGLVWEWTLDANSFISRPELRDPSGKDSAAFCGNGATGVRDAADYPASMRYALRASLKAAYALDNVGFRCAGEP